jgi:putative CocE/NonD family hydrolase
MKLTRPVLRLHIVVVAVALVSAGLWAQGVGPSARPAVVAAQPAVADGVVVMKHVMVPMRDGVTLATDVYLPARGGVALPGPFPVIVSRTPYNKDGEADGWPAWFALRGYAGVVQDVRGRYRSGGAWRPIRDDGPDGADLAAWIGRQSWSSGKIGTVGTSYAGATQLAMAIARAPHLAAMVPVDAMSNAGRYGIRHNGAFELRWFNWVFTLGNATGLAANARGVSASPGTNAGPASRRAAVVPDAAPALEDLGLRVREYLRALPLRQGTTPLALAPDYEAWLVEAMSRGEDDGFWRDMGSSVVDHVAEFADVPVYHVTGWYDSWGTQVANLNYVQLARAKKSPQRLIVGPWTHGGQGLAFAGIADFGAAAVVDMNEFRLRWFDRWLKGLDNGVERHAPVRLFVMGGGDAHKTPEGRVFVGGQWRDEQEWPLARTVPTPYYVHGDGTLSPRAPDAAGGATTFRFDPLRPVPTIGGNVSSEGSLMLRGAQDQRCRPEFWLCDNQLPLSARNDVLVFQTPPLAQDLEITGRLIVKLWASSSAPDTDFTAKLVDVYPPSRDFPNGLHLNVADSIVRARFRNGTAKAEPLTPGAPVELTIEMYPTSLLVRRGHRLRLDISSSNFPRFDVNPNTGEPLNAHRRWAIAENTVHHEAARPTHIVLPVIPAAAGVPAGR